MEQDQGMTALVERAQAKRDRKARLRLEQVERQEMARERHEIRNRLRALPQQKYTVVTARMLTLRYIREARERYRAARAREVVS